MKWLRFENTFVHDTCRFDSFSIRQSVYYFSELGIPYESLFLGTKPLVDNIEQALGNSF